MTTGLIEAKWKPSKKGIYRAVFLVGPTAAQSSASPSASAQSRRDQISCQANGPNSPLGFSRSECAIGV